MRGRRALKQRCFPNTGRAKNAAIGDFPGDGADLRQSLDPPDLEDFLRRTNRFDNADDAGSFARDGDASSGRAGAGSGQHQQRGNPGCESLSQSTSARLYSDRNSIAGSM